MPRSRAPRRVALAGVVAGVLSGVGASVLLGASPAAAHVTISVSTTQAGATAQVRMEVPHGCAGSATTEIAGSAKSSSGWTWQQLAGRPKRSANRLAASARRSWGETR